MSFSDLFDSGFKNRNKGHFSAIARVALSDGTIDPEEKEFLDRLASNLEISTEEYNEILENPNKYPINPPYLQSERLERLYDFARMVYADHILEPKQTGILTKLCFSLGFDTEKVDETVQKSLSLLKDGVDLDTFLEKMEK